MKIIILGAGFGGLRLALDLERNKRFDICLIDRKDFHIYYPALYEVVSSLLFYSERELKVSDCFYIRNIIKDKRIKFLLSEVKGVDTVNKCVETSIGIQKYDELVLALGCDVNYYGIPGLKENSLSLKSWKDVMEFRKRLKAYVEEFYSGKGSAIDVVIGGAGFSGVELACELAMTFKKNRILFGSRRKQTLLKIIESSGRVLSILPEVVSRKAHARLEKLGVEVVLNSPIKQVDEEFIHIKGRRRIHYDLFMWTGGAAGCGVVKNSILSKSNNDFVNVDQYLRVQGIQNVWGIGDLASFCPPGEDRPIPGQAYFALQEAKHLSMNIRRKANNLDLLPFVPRKKGFIIPLGGKHAVANLWEKIIIEGRFGWFLHRIIDFNYFRSILGMKSALGVLFRQLSIFDKND